MPTLKTIAPLAGRPSIRRRLTRGQIRVGLAVDVEVGGEPGDARLVGQRGVGRRGRPGRSRSCEWGPCPIPQTAPPANPAPASTTAAKAPAGHELHLGRAVDVDELDQQVLDAVGENLPLEGVEPGRRVAWSSPSWWVGPARAAGASDLPARPRLLATSGRGATKIDRRASSVDRTVGDGDDRPMCGIVGFLDKRGRRSYPTGRVVLAMLEALGLPRARQRGDRPARASRGRRGVWHGPGRARAAATST